MNEQMRHALKSGFLDDFGGIVIVLYDEEITVE